MRQLVLLLLLFATRASFVSTSQSVIAHIRRLGGFVHPHLIPEIRTHRGIFAKRCAQCLPSCPVTANCGRRIAAGDLLVTPRPFDDHFQTRVPSRCRFPPLRPLPQLRRSTRPTLCSNADHSDNTEYQAPADVRKFMELLGRIDERYLSPHPTEF
jgi:hypothetical protein